MVVGKFQKLALLGCGLIGGSLTLALKRAQLVTHIVGYDLNPTALQQALQLQAIDQATNDLATAVQTADIIVLATPVGSFGALVRDLRAIEFNAQQLPILMDVASAKLPVIELLQQELPQLFTNFVPAHPIAGKELAGIEYADVELFAAARVILTPTSQTNALALQRVTQLWQAIGAQVQHLSPLMHDEIYAAVSHLPHLLAFAYIQGLLLNLDGDQQMLQQRLGFAGSGFRDFSRIAAGDAALWRDVFLSNKQQLLQQCADFKRSLELLERSIAQEDSAELTAILQLVGKLRRDC